MVTSILEVLEVYGILISFLILWGVGENKKIGLNPKAAKLKKNKTICLPISAAISMYESLEGTGIALNPRESYWLQLMSHSANLFPSQ